jgi:hypothetical protein
VSLKYTKTCDVILNLIERWRSMIDISFNDLLEKAKKDKKIKQLPKSPKEKLEFMKKISKKDSAVKETIPLYIFFRKIPDLNKTREGEFRKNVNLKVIENGRITNINLEKLKEYAEIIERFISEIKHTLSK